MFHVAVRVHDNVSRETLECYSNTCVRRNIRKGGDSWELRKRPM